MFLKNHLLYKNRSVIFQNQNVFEVFVWILTKSLTDVLEKPLTVQKSICLLIELFNHPENNENTT